MISHLEETGTDEVADVIDVQMAGSASGRRYADGLQFHSAVILK
jgi:hypothetical protein